MTFRLLGPHVEQAWGGIPERIVQWKPPVVVTTHRTAAWSWVKEASPTVIVMRPFEDDTKNPDFSRDDWDIEGVARALVQEALSRVHGLTYDYLQLLNEPPMPDGAAVERLAQFDTACLRLLAD
jgi:hypothetical protein